MYAGLVGLYQLRAKPLESGAELLGLLPYPPPGTLVATGKSKKLLPVDNSKVGQGGHADHAIATCTEGSVAVPQQLYVGVNGWIISDASVLRGRWQGRHRSKLPQ